MNPGVRKLTTWSEDKIFVEMMSDTKAQQQFNRLQINRRQEEQTYEVNASNVGHKPQRKLAIANGAVAHIQSDDLHKLTNPVAKNHSHIVIEGSWLTVIVTVIDRIYMS